MELVSIDIKEFKKDVYEDYKKLFPEEERKAFKHLKSSFEKGITTFIKIVLEKKFIGFFIVNIVKDIKYVHLDYFAILPEYQSKGYGTEAIRKLKEDYIANHIYDFYIVKKENIEMINIKMQESEVDQVKLCNLDEVEEMLDNKQVVKRDEVYRELIRYLK